MRNPLRRSLVAGLAFCAIPFAVAESPMVIIKATGPFDVKMTPASAVADGAHYYTFDYSLPGKD